MNNNFRFSFIAFVILAFIVKFMAAKTPPIETITDEFLDTEDIPVTQCDVEDPSKPYMYLQPYDVLSGEYNTKPDDGIICSRDCDKYPDPRICYYQFVVEQYSAMGSACNECPKNMNDCSNIGCVTADGLERTILTINRQICAPSIQVCKNDRIIIDLINHLPGRDITLHFHGLYQTKTPWMDGVPMVTQCAVLPYTIFRYNFLADNPGTMLFHSHEGFQMLDGVSAPLVVREKCSEDLLTPSLNYLSNGLPVYDKYNHVIFIQDWIRSMTDERFPGYVNVPALFGFSLSSYLINGKGSVVVNGTDTGTPLTKFTVQKGSFYRFRIIASLNIACMVVITFQSHNVRVIALDESPVEPTPIGSLALSSGERADVLLFADQEVSAYWIKVQSLNNCTSAYQLAVLKYEGSPVETPISSSDVKLQYPIFNDATKGCADNDKERMCIDDITSLEPMPPALLTEKPDVRIRLTSTLYQIDEKEVFRRGVYFSEYSVVQDGVSKTLNTFTYNNITNLFPSTPILIHEIPKHDKVCEVGECPNGEHCECLHLLKIKKDAVVEIVFRTDDLSNIFGIMHPQHKHGGSYRVMYMGSNTSDIEDGTYIHQLKNICPPEKDTVVVPIGGVTVLRFIADNCGMWLIHCHVLIHGHNGMSAVLQVCERTDFKKAPDDFPTCGDYMPPI